MTNAAQFAIRSAQESSLAVMNASHSPGYAMRTLIAVTVVMKKNVLLLLQPLQNQQPLHQQQQPLYH